MISSSPTDVQPVFEAIIASAVRLAGGLFGGVYRLDGGVVHFVAGYGLNAEAYRRTPQLFPMRPDRRRLGVRTIVTRDVVDVPDVFADSGVRRDKTWLGRRACSPRWRSRCCGTVSPIGGDRRREGGAGSLPREAGRAAQTFADQAVIAIENVRLFTELEARNSELRVALEQQTATSELLKVIGRSTFDLQPVFDTLAENAVRLCEAERGLIFRFDGQVLRVVATHNVSLELKDFIERNPISPGRGSTTAAPPSTDAPCTFTISRPTPNTPTGREPIDPTRTVLAIPMLRADELLGVITIYRHEVQPFTDSQIALMETFADQAAIAIENARLLTELQTKNASLTEALEQQTATAEILRVISSSPTNIQPVLDVVAENAARLCEATDAAIFRLRGRPHPALWPPMGPSGHRLTVMPATRDTVIGRAILDRETRPHP